MTEDKLLATRVLSKSRPAKLCGVEANAGARETWVQVAVVIANYNGGERTVKCLESLERMTFKNYNVIIVDNDSSDDSVKNIRSWLAGSPLRAKTELLQMEENYGPSGAYGRGLKRGAERDFPWIWLLDQDTVVKREALTELLKAWTGLPHRDRVGILTSVPLNPLIGLPYGASGYWVRGRWKKTPYEHFSQEESFPIDLAGYSGSLIRREVVETVGVPREDFFLGWCDIEYYLRVKQKGFLVFQVPTSRVFFPMGDPRMVDIFGFRRRWRSYYSPWRSYYVVRNMTFTTVYEFPGILGILSLPVTFVRLILAIFLYGDDRKWQRIKYVLRGVVDGLRARLGKQVSVPRNEYG